MRRSEINRAIDAGMEALKRVNFFLPPFGYWTPQDWVKAGPECDRIKLNGLGWDVTDFDSGEFDRLGATLFTLRNGNYEHPEMGTPYAEKLIIMTPGQYIPFHFHWTKTEDIINRGGGILVCELFNSFEDETVDRGSPVKVFCDGIERTFKPGERIEFRPGESITLTKGVYHRLGAGETGGVLVAGEVSSINDDNTDNRFYEPLPRYCGIEEDEPARYVLCNECK